MKSILIRIDVKFDENILAYEANSTFVPSEACEPSSIIVLPSIPNFSASDPTPVSSLDDDSGDENPPLPTRVTLIWSIEHEYA